MFKIKKVEINNDGHPLVIFQDSFNNSVAVTIETNQINVTSNCDLKCLPIKATNSAQIAIERRDK